MNAELKAAFSRIKPVCDVVMVCPSVESVAAFMTRVSEMKKEAVQELQQYILYPFITHVKSAEIEKNHELQWKMVDAMRTVLEKVTVNNYEMCMKIETALLSLVFDKTQQGMIADMPEELKLSVMRCLTALILNLDKPFRERLIEDQVPLIAQVVFVAVHMAKLEKMRALRLAAIHCLTAHTATHARLTDDKYHIADPSLERPAVDLVSSILPGVLAALQDVATCTENPGHAVVVAALDATHRILCLAMHDKHLAKRQEVTAEDFAKMLSERATAADKEVSYKDKNPTDIAKRSPEWYAMAGEKLTVVTKSLVCLRTHEHHLVRRELAVYCYRLLSECNTTMQPSIPLALDVLISLAKDEYPEVSEYCSSSVNLYFANATAQARNETMDSLTENFFATLASLPRILNNIDASRKLSALNLLHGYVQVLCDGSRPQRLTAALSAQSNMQCCCNALLEAAAVSPLASLSQHATRDVASSPPGGSPWLRLRHLDGAESRRLRDVCALLGAAECAELVLDSLLETLHQRRAAEPVCVMNWMASAPTSSQSLVKRILDTYIQEDVWYLPLEVDSGEAPVTSEETLDVTVYNPRAWVKQSVPDLYEGASETRYTDISYRAPRAPRARAAPACGSLREARDNMVLCCLLTEGVGVMATRLMGAFQPYLLKTLCLVLERVGSKYEMLHLAGLKAINDVARACGHASVAQLIQRNADYFTNQITVRLKKAWNSQSALQILSVVMEYSDSSILDCLYGIVEDVLVQSCDKYHERDLHAYLQVFLTFIQCIHKWFPPHNKQTTQQTPTNIEIDLLKDVIEYENSLRESERLLDQEEFEGESGKSAEEMYREDLKEKEDNLLDYDDTVTQETQPLPQHVTVTITILKRCIHFVSSTHRDEAIMALQVLTIGLPVLGQHEDELLPLVHQTWAPLVARFQVTEPVVLRRAFDLLVVMAELSRDFIRSRAVKEVLPHIYAYLHKSAADSYLKDAGSAYRGSQAYSLQVAALTALPSLAVDLALGDEQLEAAMACVDGYLSKKQPRPLQTLAVLFFQSMLCYDLGAAWLHLRALCGNDQLLLPPATEFVKLQPVVGTPYKPTDKDYEHNINLIFNRM